MEQIQELKETFIEEYESAQVLQKLSKQKAAVILYSKALFALTDCIILKKYKKLPKNHSERFRILEHKEPIIHQIIDTIWSKYTDTYNKPATQESLLLLKKAIKEIIIHYETNNPKIKNISQERE